MNTTFESLLKLPIMQSKGQLLADVGLHNIVQYVTIMEAPDFHLSSLGEDVFVLTTLSAHHDSLEKINDVVRGLCEVSVSAIGVKLGRFVDEIHPSTVQIARDHGVPLITFDSSVYFRTVISETLTVVTGNQRQILNQINNINQLLIEAILQNRTKQDLLDLFCKEIDCYCCCLDLEGNEIVESSSWDGFDKDSVRETIHRFFEHFPEHDHSYYQDGNAIFYPCIAQEQTLAVFCIISPETQLELISSLVQPIVSGISIKFLEQNLKAQTESELMSSILDDILFSQQSNAKIIADRLEILNFKPRENHLIVLLSRIDFDHYERDYLHTIKNLQSIFAGRFESAVVFKRGSEYIVLISYSSKKVGSNLKRILDFCSSEASRTESGQFDIGCSMSVTDLSSMSECYLQSKKAVQFGRIVDRSQHVYLYDDYFELGLISCGLDSGDAKTLFQRITGPIQKYDGQSKTELWNTLEVAFQHDKLESVADALHIHISTLRYRLLKVESLTGFSYFKSRDRLTLYLAYLLHCLSNSTEGA